MFKSVVLVSLAAAACGQYAGHQGVPQYGAPQQAVPPGPLFQFSNSVNHAHQPQSSARAPAGFGAPPAPSYAAPQPQAVSYRPPPPPAAAAPAAGGHPLPNLAQLGAHNPAAGAGFANLGQVAQQNPAFRIPVPQGYEQPASGAHGGFPIGPAPGANSYRAPPQYAAPQYAAPQGAPAGNPYGGPFSYSSSVSHSAPQQAAATPAATGARY
ncbi:protein transport protein sec31-like isoform X2 [Varroa jacobsoni]|uniref:Uncharacterized protein n=1 Tax=Varroa destructor TaxID=109461 RepID=A0A7M7KDL6_VARDE|nr:protein transport protein sec31-like isoform X2 [Varroa destructor]XP_022703401.1 protein transport protein sec31-like isoform X2 [Varroa jacobsoni]